MSAVAPPLSGELTKDQLLEAYRGMRAIREFEERCGASSPREIPGFVHLYAGEEAIAVGVCTHLARRLHRQHAPRSRSCIAKGCDIGAMMAEIYGKRGGLCNGKGGSMHIADLKRACSAPTASSAPARRSPAARRSPRRTAHGQVAMAFIGDGASNQGTVVEG